MRESYQSMPCSESLGRAGLENARPPLLPNRAANGRAASQHALGVIVLNDVDLDQILVRFANRAGREHHQRRHRGRSAGGDVGAVERPGRASPRFLLEDDPKLTPDPRTVRPPKSSWPLT